MFCSVFYIDIYPGILFTVSFGGCLVTVYIALKTARKRVAIKYVGRLKRHFNTISWEPTWTLSGNCTSQNTKDETTRFLVARQSGEILLHHELNLIWNKIGAEIMLCQTYSYSE